MPKLDFLVFRSELITKFVSEKLKRVVSLNVVLPRREMLSNVFGTRVEKVVFHLFENEIAISECRLQIIAAIPASRMNAEIDGSAIFSGYLTPAEINSVCEAQIGTLHTLTVDNQMQAEDAPCNAEESANIHYWRLVSLSKPSSTFTQFQEVQSSNSDA